MAPQQTLLSGLVKGIRYRFRRWRGGDDPYRLSSWRTILIKHQPAGPERSLKLSMGRIFYRNPAEFYQAYKEIFLNRIYAFVPANQDPLIIDCGANIGLSVCFFKHQFPHCRIVAFEPDEANFALLSRNTRSFDAVELNPAAIWMQDGTITFQASSTMASRILSDGTQLNGTQVSCIRLRDRLQEPIALLKIDIEGAEYEVLNDCADSLGMVENIFVEYHGYVDETHKLERILQILKEAGFMVYIKVANDLFDQPFVCRRSKDHHFEVQLNIFGYRQISNH